MTPVEYEALKTYLLRGRRLVRMNWKTWWRNWVKNLAGKGAWYGGRYPSEARISGPLPWMAGKQDYRWKETAQTPQIEENV